MKPSIFEVKSFTHPLSDERYPTKAAAGRAYRIALKEQRGREVRDAEKARLQAIADYPRLNAESIDELRDLLVSLSKQHMGITLDISFADLRFGEVRGHYCAPMGFKVPSRKGSYDGDMDYGTHLGWQGMVRGKIRFPKSMPPKFGRSERTIGDILAGYSFGEAPIRFTGFHTNTGSYGADFEGGLYFFLADFPKLAARYARHREAVEEMVAEAAVTQAAMQITYERVRQMPESIALAAEIASRESLISAREESLRGLRSVVEMLHQQDRDICAREIAADAPTFTPRIPPKEREELAKMFHQRGY